MRTLYHPTIPGMCAVVPLSKVAEWVAQGWLKKAPPATE